MDTKDILLVMKKRLKKLNKRISDDNKKIENLKYKSRSIRMSSRLGPRINWFTDRRDELSLAIQMIEGKMSPKEYDTWLNGDEMDNLLCGIGNVGE